VRLFAAVWPDEPVRERLRALPRPETDGVRWTGETQWHVTLAFFGDQDEAAADALGGVVLAAAASLGDPPSATAGPSTRLLGRGVLCVPVGGLEAAAAAVRDGAAALGFEREARPFTGHLTLARALGRRPVPRVLAGQPFEAAWSVGTLTLARSTLGGAGSRYETVAAATVGRDGPP